jgi:hypothetical protein
MRGNARGRAPLAPLLLLLLLLLTGALAATIIPPDVFANGCDPESAATAVAYCVGETPDTSTARATVLEVTRSTRTALQFGSGTPAELGLRLTLTVEVDEANHRGCVVEFQWSVVPQAGGDRICSPTLCTSDKETLSGAACERVVPITVEVEIPAVSHEMPLEAVQYSPYEYVLLKQPEYFPQRLKHAPVNSRSPLFSDNDAVVDLITVNGGYTPQGDVIPVWQLIDPNYESDADDAFYCGRGESLVDDPSGRRQCCFRGRLFTADDDDGGTGRVGSDQNLDYGRRQVDLPNSPALLDFCAANTASAYGAPAFAWSKSDRGVQEIASMYACYKSSTCESHVGYYPAIPPLEALENYIGRGSTKLRTFDTLATEALDPYSELIDVEIAGIMATQHEYKNRVRGSSTRRVEYQQSIKNVYKIIAPELNADQGSPAYNIDDAPNLAALRTLLARDFKNRGSSVVDNAVVNGTWVTIPMKRFAPPYMRRLRCGYCGQQEELLTQACPTLAVNKAGGEDDRIFKTCPIGDVSQRCKDVKQLKGDPENRNDRCDDDDNPNIYWSEIRHVRAYAQSLWFLGTNPVCAAMRIDPNATPVTRQLLQVRVTKTATPEVAFELVVADTTSASRSGGISNNVRIDLAPGESDLAALQDVSNGAYLDDDERVVVCDSVLFANDVFTVDHFATRAPSDPFENPFDTLRHPDVVADAVVAPNATCAGCPTTMQFYDASDAAEELLWYYMDADETQRGWRAPSDIDMSHIGDNTQGTRAAQEAVRSTCGKCGVGMDLFEPDGCDAIDSDQLTKPDDGETLILPTTLPNSCLDNINSDDVDRTCKNQLSAVMPDSLGCTGRLPRLCAPTDNAPAGKYAAMRNDVARAIQSVNSPTGPRSFNDLSAYASGFPPDTDLDAPNVWLGASSASAANRALYATNKRRADLPPRKRAWRQTTLAINLAGSYAELAPTLLPCLYAIDYVPCKLASAQADAGVEARGTFNTVLPRSAPATIPPREYFYVMDWGVDATCGLRLAAQQNAPFVRELAIIITVPATVYQIEFSCTLRDPSVAVAANRTGYIGVFENDAQLLTAPVMSCDQQTAYVAQFSFDIDTAYTPSYDSGSDACSGIAAATSLRGAGVPSVLYDNQRPERDAPPEQPRTDASPSPSASPAPSAVPTNDPLSTPTTAPATATPDPSLGPQRSTSPSPTPSPSTDLPPAGDVEDDPEDVDEDNARAYWIFAAVVGGIILCLLCLCLSCCIYKRATSSDAGSLEDYATVDAYN